VQAVACADGVEQGAGAQRAAADHERGERLIGPRSDVDDSIWKAGHFASPGLSRNERYWDCWRL
jgi:hypothetical protein